MTDSLRSHPPSAAVAGPAGGPAESILLVDDEHTVRTLAARILQAEGYRVDEAGGGPEALDLFRESPHRFHLVLTDIVMPRMTGLELVEKIREVRPGMPAMGMTGFMRETIAAASRSSVHMLILQKPFSRRALLEAVRSTIDGEGAPAS